ncbi:MAG TPA: ATP-grasp domain-containing protein [Natronosporangium sp.]
MPRVVLVGRNRLGLHLACHATARGWATALVLQDGGRYRDPCGNCQTTRVPAGDWRVDTIAANLFASAGWPEDDPQWSETIVYSTVDQRVGLAVELGHRLGAIVQCDPKTPWVADKWLAGRHLADAGVPVPGCELAADAEQAVAAADRFGYPVVVKPRDMNGSRHVQLCASAAEVADAYARHLEDLRDEHHDLEFSPELLIQQFVAGPLYSVELVVGRDGPVVLGVSDRVLGEKPYFAEIGAAFPVGDQLPQRPRLEAVAVAAAEAVGLAGAGHVELVVGDAGPVLIELNARPPGMPITHMIRQVGGPDLFDLLLDALLGRPIPAGWQYEGAAASMDVMALPASARPGAARPDASMVDNRAWGTWVMARGATAEQARARLAEISRVAM